jgi:hypothetical protein
MMRREVVLAAGGYHRAYVHCEDYDLWLRLSERTRLASIPEQLLVYRHSEDQVSSRHMLAQASGAAIAWAAHVERLAGRPDPMEKLTALPPIEELDDLFGRLGVGRAVRAKVVAKILHSPVALRSEGYQLLLDHLHDGGGKNGLWRAAARLIKFNEPARALRLAAALATH